VINGQTTGSPSPILWSFFGATCIYSVDQGQGDASAKRRDTFPWCVLHELLTLLCSLIPRRGYHIIKDVFAQNHVVSTLCLRLLVIKAT
jgi:hypothetical protein